MSMGGKFTQRRIKQESSESKSLMRRRDIKLKHLARKRRSSCTIPAKADVSGDGPCKLKDKQSRTTKNGAPPPFRPTPGDHPFELAPWNDATIGRPPCTIVHPNNLFDVGDERRTNCNNDPIHRAMLAAYPQRATSNSSIRAVSGSTVAVRQPC